MVISARIVADSISPAGVRLTTIEAVFNRYVLAELNTHCDLSRNSASSRARSVKKTIEEVRTAPALPPLFNRERRGMSGGETFDEIETENANAVWKFASEQAVERAEELAALGVHKSIVNRVLEPFMWHTAVITATEWDNFFEQRLALLDDGIPAADPAFYELALVMKQAMEHSTPHNLQWGEWHLPYITQDDWDEALTTSKSDAVERLKKISVARCAGVSYLTQGLAGRLHEKDLDLYNRLRHASPPHWSPFEHVASPVPGQDQHGKPLRFFKLRGWASLRWVEQN